jgi:hypothetical protein
MLAGTASIVVALAMVRVAVVLRAAWVAEGMWAAPEARAAVTPDAAIRALAAQVFHEFTRFGYGEGTPLWVRARPFLTSRYLPAFLRVPPGAMETVFRRGWCDDSARHVAFVLSRRGIRSDQWNMVTPVGGHSALRVVAAPGQSVLLDAYYGFVTRSGGHDISPEQARAALQNGRHLPDVFESLGAGSDDRFYRDFDKVEMHAQGEPIMYVSVLPPAAVIGTINGQSDDVIRASGAHRLKPIWDYAGHKYDRAVTRVLEASADSRLSITLTENPAPAVLASLSPAPDRVEGHTMVWDLKAGVRLTMADGKAGFMPLRRRSYIPIDQIAVRAHLSDDNNGGTP